VAFREEIVPAKLALLRIIGTVRERLESLIFSRYPDKEWGTFFLYGTHETPDGIVVTVVDLIEPNDGDMDSTTAIVRFNEPYALRAALEKQKRGLCVGVIHSHPQGYGVFPSSLDDDMDRYFKNYFPAFGQEVAYFSLIFSRTQEGRIQFSGRAWKDDRDYQLVDVVTVGEGKVHRDPAARITSVTAGSRSEYQARFEEIYGAEAAARIRSARVTIIGASGTGSPAAHILARSGIEDFVLIDPQRMAKSNLERLHGSYQAHFEGEGDPPYKVEVLHDLIKAINPKAKVTCIVGNILQPLARDYAVGTDLVICCTDTNHSRTAISELAYRFLLPALDVGVVFESKNGSMSGEIARLTVYSPGAPCAYCLGLVDSWRATVELMSEEEKERRRQEAKEAEQRGDDAGAYWKDVPEIPTVGHFTSMVGALVATYAIGFLTGKFRPPHRYVEFNILAPQFDYVGFDAPPREGCFCQRLIGHADQGAHASLISAPSHWPNPKLI
jgi:molybdopterin/thiamine biosynthesis adenylyltransferase